MELFLTIHLHTNVLHKFTNIKRLLETRNNLRTEKMMCCLPDYALTTIHLSSTISINLTQLKIRFALHATSINKTSITGSANVQQMTPSDTKCLGITNGPYSGLPLDLEMWWRMQGRPWSTLIPNQIRS